MTEPATAVSGERLCPDCDLFLSADHATRPPFDGVKWEYLGRIERRFVTGWHRAHGSIKGDEVLEAAYMAGYQQSVEDNA